MSEKKTEQKSAGFCSEQKTAKQRRVQKLSAALRANAKRRKNITKENKEQ